MMYVVQKNSPQGDQWLSRASPTVTWGDKRHAMLFETRALAQMAVKIATRFDAALEVVFVPDPARWCAA